MKTIKLRLTFLIFATFFSFSLHSQNIKADDKEVQSTFYSIAEGKTLDDFITINGQKSVQSDIVVGQPPEGDNIIDVCFSQDGNKVFVANGTTNNVTVLDWATKSTIANIDVGIYPIDIETTADYALVACTFSNAVYVINVNTLNIDTIFQTSEQPVRIKVSDDLGKAYVACDINDVCEVINVNTLEHTSSIQNFPIGLFAGYGTFQNGRGGYIFTNFEITHDGTYLIAPGNQTNIYFFNTETGLIDFTVYNIQNCRLLNLSGNGNIIVGTGYDENLSDEVIYQIDIPSHMLIKTIQCPANTYVKPGINYAGTKSMVSLDNNTSALVRFQNSDYITFSETHSPKYILDTPDHNYTICGRVNQYIINYKTESIIGKSIREYNNLAAISPVLSRLATGDELISEKISFFDYSGLDSLIYLGSKSSGSYPEEDAPFRVHIFNHGEKAIYLNIMSNNIGIMDLRTDTQDTLLNFFSYLSNVWVSPDSKRAIVIANSGSSNLNDTAYIINLETNHIEATLAVGMSAASIDISPDSKYAYIGNLYLDNITVIQLKGPNSSVIANINCGNMGWIGLSMGMTSAVKTNPTGKYIAVAASFDDKVDIIDTLNWALVSQLPVGDFPLQLYFIEGTKYAVALNYFDNTYSLLKITGATSFVVNTFSSGGQGPIDVVYKQSSNELLILNYQSKSLVSLDLIFGTINYTIDLASYGSPERIILDENGFPIVKTSFDSYLLTFHNNTLSVDTIYPLASRGSFFDYSPEKSIAVVTMPGTDKISIIKRKAFNMDIKAWLEGAFANTEMKAQLLTDHFPLSQPFDAMPWDYQGHEHVYSIPSSDIVDWVMVEIRETTGDSSSATTDKRIDRKAGFILKNGQIVGLDGTSLLSFNHIVNDHLYAILWHRNHLPIMSSIPLSESNGIYTYDFTGDTNLVYGGAQALKELSPGYWGMISGDANADGIIDLQDMDSIWSDDSGKSGFLKSDFDMNGQTDNKDKNDYWLPNEGASVSIPE